MAPITSPDAAAWAKSRAELPTAPREEVTSAGVPREPDPATAAGLDAPEPGTLAGRDLPAPPVARSFRCCAFSGASPAVSWKDSPTPDDAPPLLDAPGLEDAGDAPVLSTNSNLN